MKYTKAQRRHDLIRRLENLGFTFAEVQRLRRIEMTLSRWSEAECNGEIERNEKTGKPERVSRAYLNGHSNERHARPIPDRERGALCRLAAIMLTHPELWYYHQGDPRGCALYVGRREDMRPTSNPIVDKAKSYGLEIVKRPGPDNPLLPSSYSSPQFPGRVFDVPEQAARAFLKLKGATVPDREPLPLDQYYTRGVAVCD